MNSRHSSYVMLSIIFLCFSLNNHLSDGIDTISENQSLSGDQTIISSGGGIFELGFFQPAGKSSNFYIGMWYKKISMRTIVWVANRDTPISDKYSSKLKILNGNLVLLNESQTTIWSTNIIHSTTTNISVIATLGDDGNLILKDAGSTSNSTQPIWQSFDYPTHTFLPGSKIRFNKITNKSQILTSWKNLEDPAPGLFSLELDPNGSQYLIRWNRSETYWTSGAWNGNNIFSLIPEMRLNYIFNYSYVSNDNESYFTYSLYDPTIISRLIMDVTGQIKQLTWLDGSGLIKSEYYGAWNLFWSQPRLQCEVYAYCGAFSTCNQIVQPFCNCFPSFVPKWGSDWNLSDFSGGCVRNTSLQCEENSATKGVRYRFWEESYMGLPQADENPSVQSTVQCESICLDRCNCTAYAYGISGCSIWYGELFNVKQLSESGGTVYIKLAAYEFPDVSSPNNNYNKAVVIGSVIGSIAVSVALIAIIVLRRWKHKQAGSSERGILDWDQRYNIIEGIARGLLYLHRDSRLRVIHRDLKPGNILLDEDMNPKISDFGMAKMFGRNQTLANTNRIVGTYGYMSPEYAMQGLFSEKSDVFSFGVLLLEIVSSKKNTNFYHHENHLNLLGYAWQLWNEGKAFELLDQSLANSKSPSQVMRCIHMGLLCVQEQAKDRPTMSTIVSMLCNESTLQTPKQPAFILDKSSTESDSPMPNDLTCSRNCISITTIGGR